jgi:hypothetical protein
VDYEGYCMTLRAVILGLLGAATVCTVTYYNDHIMHQTFFVGNNMPVSVYGGLILFLLILNPLLFKLRERFALSGGELAVILAMTLASCAIPGSGLMRTFTDSLMLPHRYAQTDAGWKKQQATSLIPSRMLAGYPPQYDEEDILDPRAVARRIVAQASAGTPASIAHIRSLVSADEAQDLASGLKEAMVAPDPSLKSRALQLLDDAVAEYRARRQERQEERELSTGAAGEELPPLAEADLAGMRAAIDELFSAPTETTSGTSSSVRHVTSLLREAGLSEEYVEAIADTATDALLETEASCREAVSVALNGLLEKPELDTEGTRQGVVFGLEVRELMDAGPERLDAADSERINRELLDSAFDSYVVSAQQKEDRALSGFIQGVGVAGKSIKFSEVPWGAWTGTLSFWIPVILLLWFALIGLAVVVHRQWAHHEQLAYPVAMFASSLFPNKGSARSSVLRDRFFWGGMAVVFAIHLNNYAAEWFPKMVRIPLGFDFASLRDLFPTFNQGSGSGAFFYPRLFPTVVAFAFFLAGDVSLSLGLGPFLYTLITGVLVGYGVSTDGGGYLGSNLRSFFTFGAYLGVVFMISYTGRRYYSSVFRKAFFLRSHDEVEQQAVWGARAFVAALFLLMVDLVVLGLDWPLVIMYTLITVVMFLVMSRIMAETGLFFIQTYWFPCAIISGLMGATAIGPSAMMIMMMLTTVLLIDPRESIMPFVVNSLKLADQWKVKVGKTALWSGGAVALGLFIAIPLILYWQYDGGTNMADGWATVNVPRMGFDQAVRVKERLVAQDSLELAESTSGFGKVLAVSPDGTLVGAMVAGLAMVLLFSVFRLRWPRWPLHPVMFLIWGTYPGAAFASSFLVGWLVKRGVTKYGGEKVYRMLRPMMFGLIAGDMLGGITPSLIGALWFFVTGEAPKSFSIMPG